MLVQAILHATASHESAPIPHGSLPNLVHVLRRQPKAVRLDLENEAPVGVPGGVHCVSGCRVHKVDLERPTWSGLAKKSGSQTCVSTVRDDSDGAWAQRSWRADSCLGVLTHVSVWNGFGGWTLPSLVLC